MRFEISGVLDAIERRLTGDPVLAGAIVNIGEILRATELDGGRPTYLPRLGSVIDALAVLRDDGAVPVYAIAEKSLLSSLDLTSNEKMVLRRWADDGLIEVLADGDPGHRLMELAALTGLPVLSRGPLPVRTLLVPLPGVGGVALIERHGQEVGHPERRILARLWRCPDGEGVQVPTVQSDAQPKCPRHGLPLTDAGPRPAAVAMTAWVGGEARVRFAVTGPVLVGRNPSQGVMLGPWLNDESIQWVSRNHVGLEVREGQVLVTDQSTNGTVVIAPDRRIDLVRDQGYPLGEQDSIELYDGVLLTRAGQRPGRAAHASSGIMADAPTIAIRLPPMQ